VPAPALPPTPHTTVGAPRPRSTSSQPTRFSIPRAAACSKRLQVRLASSWRGQRSPDEYNEQLFGSGCHHSTRCSTPLFARPRCTALPPAQTQMGTAHKGHSSLGKTKTVVDKEPTPPSPGCCFHTDFWYGEEGRRVVETCSHGCDFCGAGTQSGREASCFSPQISLFILAHLMQTPEAAHTIVRGQGVSPVS